MKGWTHPIPHVPEKVHELCDRVAELFHVNVLDMVLEGHLPVELGKREAVLSPNAGSSAGAG